MEDEAQKIQSLPVSCSLLLLNHWGEEDFCELEKCR